MSERSWIVVDLVVHPAWSLGGQDREVRQTWDDLRDALSGPPHLLVSVSTSDEQALIYAVTTDRSGFLETARRHAPEHGVASFVAKVWSKDPRHSDEPPEEIELTPPQPAWPKPGYGEDLVPVLEQSQMTEAPMRRAPDYRMLVAQYSASVHRLRFAIGSGNAPFGQHETRSLAHGALLSVRALSRVAPSELTALAEEAESALARLCNALEKMGS